jgi:hypothetical protein
LTTQSINISSIYLITVPISISLYLHALFVLIFKGTNFLCWSKQVQFYLCVIDLDLALQIEKSITITDSSNMEEKTLYKSWERSNRLNIIFIQMSIVNNIKSILPKYYSGK